MLDASTAAETLAEDVRRGLTSSPKFLLPKYFYDSAGSALFEQITVWAPEAMDTARPEELVELGSGSTAKANILLSTPWGQSGIGRYVPFDVDSAIIHRARTTFGSSRPRLQVKGVGGDFERHPSFLPEPAGRRMIAFLGSTIGNVDSPARQVLLTAVRQQLGAGGYFLLGLDLVKDAQIVELAYNDPAGVTAAFNLNILKVVNEALDGNFQPEAFRHHAFYNASQARIEMHLVASSPQDVLLRRLGLRVPFAADESIWTENSYKFTRESTVELLREADLRLEAWRTDSQSRFALAFATPQ